MSTACRTSGSAGGPRGGEAGYFDAHRYPYIHGSGTFPAAKAIVALKPGAAGGDAATMLDYAMAVASGVLVKVFTKIPAHCWTCAKSRDAQFCSVIRRIARGAGQPADAGAFAWVGALRLSVNPGAV
jgi:hypothetical protein